MQEKCFQLLGFQSIIQSLIILPFSTVPAFHALTAFVNLCTALLKSKAVLLKYCPILPTETMRNSLMFIKLVQ